MPQTQFKPIKDPWGGIDEQATQDAFVDFVGGTSRADYLQYLNNQSFPIGTKYDFLYGTGLTKEQVFRKKALNAGYTEKQIDAFLML
jgi:hypothetical protein